MRSPYFLLGLLFGITITVLAHVPLIRPLAMGCHGSNMHACGALQ